MPARRDEPWVPFVLKAPRGTRALDLAAVVGCTVPEVSAIRAGGVLAGNETGRATFGDLFAEWHGRPPEDREWPAPTRVGANGLYEWQTPEDTLLASLVGQLGDVAIAKLLTTRLRSVTGDKHASRSRAAVQLRRTRIGLHTADVLGGLTVPQAGREYGSENVVRDAIARGELKPRRVGRLFVIPYDQWTAWVAGRRPPPADYVQLTTLKEPLGIRSDKLSEFARMGYVPSAQLCHPNRGDHSGARGTWYIPRTVADQLRDDRRAGRPMPWHGKPMLDNLRTVWKRWTARKHPTSCETCARLWGVTGAPKDFDDFVARYPGIEHGAKRHLTMIWSPGLTVNDVARKATRPCSHVRRAIRNGQLAASQYGGKSYVTKTACTRWIAAGSPGGEHLKDWLALSTASKRFGFPETELAAMIADGHLVSRRVTAGPKRKELQVPARQVAALREQRGFTEEEAAAKVGVSLEDFRRLADGVNWRGETGIPLSTVQAITKRRNSRSGHSIEAAAFAVGRSEAWVQSRIDDGTVVLYSRPWSDRTYITDLGLQDLKRAASIRRVNSGPAGDWIAGVQAAHLAGVSITTVLRWSDANLIRSRPTPRGRAHERESVKAQARRYWAEVRFLRDTRPDWLKEEQPEYRPRRRHAA